MSSFLSETNLIYASDYFFGKDVITSTPCPIEIPVPYLEDLDLSTLKDNCVIAVWGFLLPQFFANFMPKIQVKYVLVIVLSDFTLPLLSKHHPWPFFWEFINTPNLLHVFAVNTEIYHPKITPIPLGLPRSEPFPNEDKTFTAWYITPIPYHVIPYFVAFENASPLDIMRSKKDNPLLYVRFSVSTTLGSHVPRMTNFRQKLIPYLEKNNIPFSTEVIGWRQYMDEMREYKFCLQPYGTCPNAYRMFESIIVGTIPVFFRSPVVEAYKNLPIVVLDEMEDLKLDFLEKEYERIVSRTFDFSRLKTEFWSNKIRRQTMFKIMFTSSDKKDLMSKSPFPFLVKDSFLEEKFAQDVQKEILDLSEDKWDRYNNPFEDKHAIRDKYNLPENTKKLYDAFYSSWFIQELSELTGITLLPDPDRNFAGIHKNGKILDVHVDAGLHPKTLQKKQLTLGLYLSENWKNTSEGGGDLELWSGDSSAHPDAKIYNLKERISPLFNRLILFMNSDTSWHGMTPILENKDRTRIFLTVSYLSENTTDENKKVKAFFVPRPGDIISDEKERLRFLRADPERCKEVYRCSAYVR